MKKNIPIILIVVAATLLRTWNLTTHMIFFGDAAHDMLSAATAVQTHSLPLLGIASSVPRFHQGPLTVWLEMVIFLLAGYHTIAYGFIFALISVLAVIFLYEIMTVYVNKESGLIAATLLAFSPLAIASGRTPYHTTPIPLFLIVYLFALMNLWKHKKASVFFAVLSFCLLFQFELANAPLLLLIPFVLWRSKYKIEKKFWFTTALQACAGVLLGLLPQLMYDATHGFAQLGGFATWVAYRCVAFFGYKQQHVFSVHQFATTLSILRMFFGRIWNVDNPFISILFVILFIAGIASVFWKLKNQHKQPLLIEVSAIAAVLLLISYIVHGVPGEAYFSPFFVLSAVMVTTGITAFKNKFLHQQFGLLITALLIGYAFINTLQIFQANFFVSTTNNFNYSYSLAEQRDVVNTLLLATKQHIRFKTTQQEGQFSNYFDNLRWLLAEKGLQEDQKNGQDFYIETKDSPLQGYPNYTKFIFPSVDAYRLGLKVL